MPDGAAVTQALIAREVIVDHRPGAGIRIAPHFYNTEAEIDTAVETMADIMSRPANAGGRGRGVQ